jgi:hypothetical protein
MQAPSPSQVSYYGCEQYDGGFFRPGEPPGSRWCCDDPQPKPLFATWCVSASPPRSLTPASHPLTTSH